MSYLKQRSEIYIRHRLLNTGVTWRSVVKGQGDQILYKAEKAQEAKQFKEIIKKITKKEKDIIKKQYKKLVAKTQEIPTITLIDSINNYRRYVVTDNKKNKLSLKTLFKTIKYSLNKTDLVGKKYISILFKYDGNKMKGITIKEEYLTNYNSFIKRIEEIQKEGDYIPNYWNNKTLILNKFTMNVLGFPAFGKSDTIILKTIENNKSDNKLCINRALEFITNKKIYKPIIDYKELINYINDNQLNCNVLLNMIKISKDKFNNRKYIDNRTKINNDDYQLCYLYKVDNSDFNIVYDHLKQHVELCEIELKDNLYLNKNFDIIDESNKIILNFNNIIKNYSIIKEQDNNVYKYIFFDYETVYDIDELNFLKPYSLAFYVCTEQELIELTKLDKQKNIDSINKIIKKNTICETSFNCSNRLINYIIDNQKNTSFKLVSFNGSNFDNYILLNDISKYNQNNEIGISWVSNIFFSNNQLLNFKINKRHDTFDLAKHLTGSLASLCKSFKVCTVSKKSINHDEIQQLYEKDKKEFIKNISNKKEIIEYNIYDVLALAIIYKNYSDVIGGLNILVQGNRLTDSLTIGSMIYKKYIDHINKLKIKLPKLDIIKYNDLIKNRISARCDIMYGEKQHINESVCSFDLCSEYPYVMFVKDGAYYPSGEIIETDKYVDNKLGFYYCNINQDNLIKQNKPLIWGTKTKEGNNWHIQPTETVLISTIIIEQLKKYGCKVDIINGFYFTEKIRGYDMFNFLVPCMKEKNKQDGLKPEEMNGAIRTVCKLIMNSLSGKVTEGLHLETTESINNMNQIIKKYGSDSIKDVLIMNNALICTYKKNIEDVIKKQHPVYIGNFIYDYAKEYMYDNAYNVMGNKCIYTDTDCLQIRDSDKDIFINHNNNKIVPHWKEMEIDDPRYITHKIYEKDSKVFGSYENEVKENNGAFYYSKKSYCIYNNTKSIKASFKGVNNKSILLTGDESFINKKYTTHKDGVKSTKLIINNQKEAREYIINNQDKSFENNTKAIFSKLFNNDDVYVLQNFLTKIYKNKKKYVSIGIQSNILIKKL